MQANAPIHTILKCILGVLTVLNAVCARSASLAHEYWGAETNGVKAGLSFQLAPDSTNQVQVFFVPVLVNSRTNNFNIEPGRLLILFPPFEYRYKMELTEAAGKPVNRTGRGKAIGKTYVYVPPTHVHSGSSLLKGVNLTPNNPQFVSELVTKGSDVSFVGLSLQDYFKIRKSGKYHLKFQMNVIFWRDEPDHLLLQRMESLPTVDADLDLQLPQKTFPGLFKTYGIDILGVSLCVVGVVWLVVRLRMRRT